MKFGICDCINEHGPHGDVVFSSDTAKLKSAMSLIGLLVDQQGDFATLLMWNMPLIHAHNHIYGIQWASA